MSDMATTKVGPRADLEIQSPHQEASLLDTIIQEGRLARQPSEREKAEEQIRAIARAVLDKNVVVDGNLERGIKAYIAALDAAISEQLTEVMHHEDLRKLEGSWRGLHDLVYGTQTGERLKVKVLNATKEEMLKDLRDAGEFDQSLLFKKVYTSEYSMFGGAPYGFLVGDYEFGPSSDDMELLREISKTAAAAHAPFVAAAAPEMFNLESWTELNNPRDLALLFEGPGYAAWRSFRASEESRYVALTLPRYLARVPYGERGRKAVGFKFEEGTHGTDHDAYIWSSAAYAYGLRVTEAFARYNWCTAIRGVEGGGRVDGLPVHVFETDEGEGAMKIPTEVAIDERRDKELSDLGFISLVHCKGESYAAFFGGQTTNKPRKYVEDSATANAELSARLPYIMAVSRIAHYLKAIVRDKIGGFTAKEEIQKYLQGWISQYVLLNDGATQEAKARKPLREALITVEEDAASPGNYRAVAYLRPHFQLEGLNMSLRLVAKLPSSAS